MCLAAAAPLLPAQAATKVSTYEQAQASLNDEGYLLFIYGQGWDKRSKELTTALYNSPAIAQAAGGSVMMLVPLPESMASLKVLHDLYSGKTLPVQDGAVRVELQVGEGLILQ